MQTSPHVVAEIARKISVLVPAYNRARFLQPLLESVLGQTARPLELVIVEDFSPEREHIRRIVKKSLIRFESIGVKLRYIENPENYGYDKNLRCLVDCAYGDYGLFLGNDDELTPDAVKLTALAILESGAHFVSRSIRQHSSLGNGKNREVGVINASSGFVPGVLSDLGQVFGLCAVISGLTFKLSTARDVKTTIFDGGLYYQYHLALACNAAGGSCYVKDPVVSCRADLAPEFGASGVERAFTPGRYTAIARIRMATSVVQIYLHHRQSRSIGSDLRKEMNLRQSIHIFEIMSGASRAENWRLFYGFYRQGLFLHPVPVALLGLNLILGSRGRPIFLEVKRIVKRWLLSVGLRSMVRNSGV